MKNDWIDYKTGQPVQPVATNARRVDAGEWEDYEAFKARLAANQGAPATVATGDWEPYVAPTGEPANQAQEPARPVVLTRRNVLTTCRATVGDA